MQRAKYRSGEGNLRAQRAIGENNCGFPFTSAGLSEAERSPLKKRASSETLNAESIATKLGRDPDMRRNVTKTVLLAP